MAVPTIVSETPFDGPGADQSHVASSGWQVGDLLVWVACGQRIGALADYNSITVGVTGSPTMTQEVSFEHSTVGGTTRTLKVWLYWWRATAAGTSSTAVTADHPLSSGLGAVESKLLVVRGAVATGNPFVTATLGNDRTATSEDIQFPTVSAVADSLVFQLLSHGESSGSAGTPGVAGDAAGFSNSDLSSFTCNEYQDSASSNPTTNEQVVALLSGEAPSGGTVGDTTATPEDATSAEALLTFSIAPGVLSRFHTGRVVRSL